jgi:hypothetical protein
MSPISCKSGWDQAADEYIPSAPHSAQHHEPCPASVLCYCGECTLIITPAVEFDAPPKPSLVPAQTAHSDASETVVGDSNEDHGSAEKQRALGFCGRLAYQ